MIGLLWVLLVRLYTAVMISIITFLLSSDKYSWRWWMMINRDVIEAASLIKKKKRCAGINLDMNTTHTRLTALCPGLPGRAGTRTVKPIWILLKQETVSGSGIGWTICKSAPRSRQITTPAPHHSSFLQAGCPSCRPTNSVKALKAIDMNINKM